MTTLSRSLALVVILLLYTNTLLNSLVGAQWKQVIGLFLFVVPIISLMRMQFEKNFSVNSAWVILFAMPFIVSFALLFFNPEQSYFYVYDLIGVFYLLYFYISTTNATSKLIKKMFLVSYLMSAITSIGIFSQFLFEPFNYFIQGLTANPDELSRPSFLLGSSTLLFSAYAMPLLLYLKLDYKIQHHLKNSLPLLIIASIFCIFLSGSRSSLLLYLIFVSVFIATHLKIKYIQIIMLIIVFGFVYFIGDNIDSINLERYVRILEFTDAGNVARVVYWSQFIRDISSDLTLFGPGLGYLKTNPEIYNTIHFESSLISTYYQLGLVGLFLFFVFPACCLMFIDASLAAKLFVALFLIQSTIAPTFFNYHAMVVLGIALARNKRQIEGPSAAKTKSVKGGRGCQGVMGA